MSFSASNVSCTVCNNNTLKTIIDFGQQPPSNRFVAEANLHSSQEMHQLALGYCLQCGTIQLTQRMPIDSVRPHFNWLVYNEPEGHLDGVAEELIRLPGINKESRILGITYKDQSTIDRLAKLGLPIGVCMHENDFGFHSKLFGLETVQQLLTQHDTINHLKTKFGTANILLMRHIIEHASDPAKLIRSLRSLVAENGYLVMELPDSEKIFRADNHAFIWEEHISYFTEETLQKLARSVGAKLAWFKRCSYAYEDSLLAAFQFHHNDNSFATDDGFINDVDSQLKKFSEKLEAARLQWKQVLLSYREKGEMVAVFGAGHLAAKFINFLQLKDLIDCVIDDNPNKKGMRMPGSLLPIVPSKELAARNIRVCISTLSPESELKVRQKLTEYFDNGGVLIPAFTVVRDMS